LKSALSKMESTTKSAYRCADQLASRAGRLGSLTGPASDASSMLSHANANLAATLILMRDAREKFDTLSDCEPAIDRVHRGVLTLEDRTNRAKGEKAADAARAALPAAQRVNLTEQDVYAAGDSMEILRDAYRYFAQRTIWRAAPSTLSSLERLYKMGEDSMSLLISLHLKGAGQGAKPQRNKPSISPAVESAEQTRDRLNNALQNRDLLKNIGEYDEYQPLEARPIREIRAIFECLTSYGYNLGPAPKREPSGLSAIFGLQPQHISRTEKVGSGCYNKLTKIELVVGFPQLDAYGMARREIAYSSMDAYYRRLRRDRKAGSEKSGKDPKKSTSFLGSQKNQETSIESGEADAAARDAVRCLEHAMVIIAGEKNVYRTIVTPSLNKTDDEDEEEEDLSPFYKKACVASYAYVVGSVVDRALDIIETVFLKEGGIGQTSGSSTSKEAPATLTVPEAYSAAAAGLRMLDGVRMLGPSLAKLCEMNVGDNKTESNTSISAVLCIAIHRTTVKNAARTLENLAKAIQDDPMKGPLHRPKNASVSSVSKDVVDAIRSISPFVSAYKSVSKRRALPWDPNMGEDAGEMDSFVRYLVMRLLNSLKGKALDYTRDGRDDSQAKAHIFMINNAYYLLEELGNDHSDDAQQQEQQKSDADFYRISGSWFDDKVNKMMDSEKKKYLEHWEALNTHLTAVDNNELEFLKNDAKTLSHESGRLIKSRFSGFNESFEKTYQLHKTLCIIDARLRLSLQQEVTSVFVPRYRRFFEKYTKVKFSKKHQGDYAKYSPERIEEMMGELYVDPEDE